MSMPRDRTRAEFGEPATYRIVVQGRREEYDRRRLGNMTVESTGGEGPNLQTTLVGVVQDQAELRGVMDALYGLHLPVVALQRIEGEAKS